MDANSPGTTLHGPRIPSIGFWYDNTFLGEAMYPLDSKDPIATAKNKVLHYADRLVFGDCREPMIAMLKSRHCVAKFYQ